MPVTRFNRQALPAQPWKNGGGSTCELVCLPDGSDLAHFDWRVSIARIARSGPFSAFDGIDRVITLLDGDGVRLHTADGTVDHRLDRPLQPYAFAGEAAVQADLLGAACHDLNVMTRRAACSARVQVLRQATALPPGRQGLLFAVHGSWGLAGGRSGPEPLGPGDGLWWQAEDHSWQLDPLGQPDPGCALIVVLVDHAGA